MKRDSPRVPWFRKIVTVAAATLCWLAACKGCPYGERDHPDDRPTLGSVVVKSTGRVSFRGTEFSLDDAQLTERVKSVLTRTQVFSESGSQSARQSKGNISLEVQVLDDGASEHPEIGVRLRLRVSLRPEGASPARLNEDTVATGQVPLAQVDASDIGMSFQRLAERTAEDLLLAYAARQKLWVASAPEVTSALESRDTDLRVEALRIIGARKLHEAVPEILRLLSDEDEVIRDAALGAVVELREQTAVKALAESRQMRDVREMRKVLDAIATLGGEEASDYLAFVAETHDDEDLRAMAKEALRRLKRHSDILQTTK